uniref:Uncharacterized protein n=1 Tax=Physcomitrium patens TaxID=3218 RepID=A0A2K1JMH6_PHYPA|nr:hypothetical protein PHYPA_017563 [Physcomitrium patens]
MVINYKRTSWIKVVLNYNCARLLMSNRKFQADNGVHSTLQKRRGNLSLLIRDFLRLCPFSEHSDILMKSVFPTCLATLHPQFTCLEESCKIPITERATA